MAGPVGKEYHPSPSSFTSASAAAAFLAAIVDSSDDAIIGKTLDGTIVSWNPAAERMYGYRADEVVGRNISLLVPPERTGELARILERLAAGERVGHHETVRRRRNGELLDVSVTVSPVCDASGNVIGASAIARDISARKRYEELIEHQAFHDPLTELPNRASLRDRVEHALSRGRRSGRFVAVLFLDLDDFKVINDTFGHATGDLLLQLVAQRLRKVVRPDDTVARFGGDEFVIVCNDVGDESDAMAVAQRVSRVLDVPFHLYGVEVPVTASIGIALGSAGDHPDTLLHDADNAMYRCKGQGALRIAMAPAERESGRATR